MMCRAKHTDSRFRSGVLKLQEMGSFISLFGGGQEQSKAKTRDKITQHDKAVLALKNQRDQLKKYVNSATTVIEKEVETARRFIAEGKKEKARLCLRKKKFQENLLKQAEQTLANVDEMINTIEFTQIQQSVFEGLKKGSETLKELQKQMTVDDVEEMLLDTQEALEHQREVDRMLSERLSPEDDEDILQELNDLKAMDMEEPMDEDLKQMPAVPKHAEVSPPSPMEQDNKVKEDEVENVSDELDGLEEIKAEKKRAILA